MTKLTQKKIIKNQSQESVSKKKKVGGQISTLINYDILFPRFKDVYSGIIMDLFFSSTKNIRIKNLEEKLEKIKIEMDKNKPLHLKVYDGIIKLFEKYPKILIALGSMLTPVLIYKLSKNILGTKVTKVTSPPKSIVKLMKMYLKNASKIN